MLQLSISDSTGVAAAGRGRLWQQDPTGESAAARPYRGGYRQQDSTGEAIGSMTLQWGVAEGVEARLYSADCIKVNYI